MFKRLACVLAFGLMAAINPAWADEYSDTINVFRNAGESGKFVDSAYGYAVFPTIGKVGVGIGGAHGKGRVYRQGKYIGDASMTQISIGAQLGGEAFSEMIFFEDERALNEFTSGNFEFEAKASATAITANASATAGTAGASGAASGGRNDATTMGKYNKGIATFTVTKGGLMYEAAIGGQKFSFKPR